MPQGVHLKHQFNCRISDEAHAIVRELQEHLGLTQAGVLELVLRDYARSRHLPKMSELLRKHHR
jgi:antitoxin component of RelBE/YafQ-DinJ toxin-antitoxin module